MWPAALPQEACRRVSAMLLRERERDREIGMTERIFWILLLPNKAETNPCVGVVFFWTREEAPTRSLILLLRVVSSANANGRGGREKHKGS